MKAITKAIRFLESLSIPEGLKAGELIKLAPLARPASLKAGALPPDMP